jgi:polyisoprenoid-binding protein YceI
MKTLKTILPVLSLLYFISCGGPQTENKVEATEPAAEPEATESSDDGATYTLQTQESSIKWMGSNKFTPKKHEGTIQPFEGSFTVANNQITGGNFVVDMNTINSGGYPYTNGQEKVGNLIGHLKSADFFDVANHPHASFSVTSVAPLEGDPQYTHQVTGNMTIKGITKQITIPAAISISGNDLSASSTFTIDRSQWEVKYGSESFFPDLVKDKLINNEVELTVNLMAKAGIS